MKLTPSKIKGMKNFYIILIALFLVKHAMAQWFPNSGTTNGLNSVFFTSNT